MTAKLALSSPYLRTYGAVEPDGRMNFDRQGVGAYETLEVEDLGNGCVALKSGYLGKYGSVQPDGSLTFNRERADVYEMLEYRDIGGGCVSLRSPYLGKYGSVQPDGTIRFDRDAVDVYETIGVTWIEKPPQPGPEPGPEPIPPQPITPGTWPARHAEDFCNMQINGEIWWDYVGDYYAKDRSKVYKYYQEVLKRGYSRANFNFFTPDYFGNPQGLVPYLEECIAHGIGPVLEMLPIGSEKEARAKYTDNPSNYMKQLHKFVPVVEPYVAEYIIMPEADDIFPTLMPEDVTNPAILDAGATIRQYTSKPVWVHFSSGWHGEWGSEFWGKAKDWATGLCFQYKKTSKGSGGQFDTSKDEVREAAALYSSKLHGVSKHLQFRHGEATYKYPESHSYELAVLAMENGATDSMNGGPGVK